ncbi:MAG TPA: glycosyltransferase [Steroidobacteraceae bacterium]|nr:glycosyltransferase [Steroidobacteraceae bacterium]
MQMSRPVLPDESLPLNTAESSALGPLLAYGRAHASQLIRFVLIGAGVMSMNLALLYCLRALTRLPDPVAVAVVYVFGTVIHFSAHRWITYGVQDRPIRPQGLRYAVMLVCNFLILQALVALGARLSISPYIAFMGSTGCTMVFNFLVMTHFVFARRHRLSGLPGAVVDILRERGVTEGSSVLLLTDGPPLSHGHRRVPQYQLTRGVVGEAAALASRGGFAAVVLNLPDTRMNELERILATIAPVLPQGVTLVATLGERRIDRDSAHLLLLRSGYDRVWIHSHRRTLCVSARRAAPANAVRTCSIIVPVYNERNTFPELMRMLLAKPLDHLGLEREIILVESNSTDGSRELVAGFAATPGIKILYQDRPRGKGNAVRAGLAVATGDIVLIQDADLEYDVNDYDVLLEPLLAGRAAFVLGARHGGRLRMRRFQEQKVLGEALNVAHVLLAGFINVLYGQSMKDPFTMFKVFRRECVYGLQFECNKFDFDHELVIKLVLKGYRPLEIPVNYCARSFSQGKKISFFRDPPGLIAADLKYRVRRLRPRFE